MDDKQIQDIADRVIEALQHLAPSEPSGWALFPPFAALIAAGVVAVVGWHNLKQQQLALATQVSTHESTLTQKREADARSEWWRRTQWALEAAASDDPRMYGYGAGMLDLLAKSELAGPHDKALLDAVWLDTSTEMQDKGIQQLIEDAGDQTDLTDEEAASLRSFFVGIEDSAVISDAVFTKLVPGAPKENAEELQASTEPVDDSSVPGNNESSKEEDDDNRQDVQPGA